MDKHTLDRQAPPLGGRVFLSLVCHDFKARYAGTALGGLWAFIQPVATVLLYWFVYRFAFASGEAGGVPYVLWLICGIAPWFFFSDGLAAVTAAYTDYAFLVSKVRFRAYYLPVIRTASALCRHLFFLLLMLLAGAVYGYVPQPANLLLAYYLVCTTVFLYAVGRITALLHVYLRDTGSVVQTVLQFGFWLTPIFWDAGNLPEAWQSAAQMTPIFYLVQGYRDAVLGSGTLTAGNALCFWGVCAVLLAFGARQYRRVRPCLADQL